MRPLRSLHCGCAARLTHRSLAEAFDAWCFFVADRQRTLQHLQIALAHWGKATLISTWQAWQEHTLYSAQRREIIARALQHFLNRTQAAAFRQWQEVVLRKKEGAGKAAMCLQRLLNSRLSAAFQGWQEAACELRDKHMRMQRAAVHFLNQRLAICFLTWRAASEEALMGAAKLEHAVGHWLHGTVSKVFNAWRECAQFKAYSRPIISGEQQHTSPFFQSSNSGMHGNDLDHDTNDSVVSSRMVRWVQLAIACLLCCQTLPAMKSQAACLNSLPGMAGSVHDFQSYSHRVQISL